MMLQLCLKGLTLKRHSILDPRTRQPASRLMMTQDRSFQNDPSPENVNVLPGGSSNTAGGRVKDANVVDAIKTINPRDFREVHKKPCVRDAFLAGIGIGFGTGGIRAILGGTSTRKPFEHTS